MHCAVIGCTTDNQSQIYKDEVFFKFPNDVNMCKAWKYACGRADDFSTDATGVCELHFDKSDYEKNSKCDGLRRNVCCRLKTYAIPTLNLSKLSENSQNVIFGDRTEITDRTYFKRNISDCIENDESHLSSHRKCAVSSCKFQDKLIFDFPDPKQNKKMYQKWLSFCKNEELTNIPAQEINNTYGICDAHFGKKILTLHDSVPTIQLPAPEQPVKNEVYESNQLCRLCFNLGSIDVFSCKYYKKVLKDIIKIFLPIEIKKGDVSTLVCQSCKCEVIRFYNFLLKSLQVDEYFQAITKEVNNENYDDSNCVIFIEPNVSLIKVKENEQDNRPVDSQIEQTVLIDDAYKETVIIDDVDKETVIIDDVDRETIVIDDVDNDVESSLLRKCLTSGNRKEKPAEVVPIGSNKVKEKIVSSGIEENTQQVPAYVMKYFHSYVKTSNKKLYPHKKKSRTSPELLDPNQEYALEVEIVETNDKNSDTIICIHCNKVIENIENFNEHCRLENHAPVFTCTECHRMFKDQIDLDTHFDTHKKNEKCICERCGKQFTKRESLYSHLNFVHSGKIEASYACNVCTKKFATNYRLKLHMRTHTNDRPYCCEKCGAVFTMLVNLRNHQTIHSDYKPHICLICNKGFSRRHKLAIHLTKHTGERKYSCEQCGVAYKRKVNLTRHNRKKHTNLNEDIDEQPNGHVRSCPQCDFTCNFSVQLKFHMLRVHKSYTCTICEMTFQSYQPFYNHNFKHFPNKKKFVCVHCNKRFANANLLDVHMVVHTGKKKFQCNLCNKKFSQRPHLQSHLLTHTGERPHKCKFCAKCFAHLSTLVVHERTHTGETPYVCQFCNKGFGHLTNYKKHVFSQHGVVMPKKRDYSSVKKISEENDTEDNGTEMANIITDVPEYILINNELLNSEHCEIVTDSNDFVEIKEELV